MRETLFQSLYVALSAVALAIIVRNAPVVRGWVQEAKKPWACNVCLPLYLCAIVVGGLFLRDHDFSVLLAYLPSYALSYIVLEKLARPTGEAPFVPPEFRDES